MSLRGLLTTAAISAAYLTSTAAAADVKLGYVDLQRALLEVEEGRQAKARLQQILDSKQKELDKEQEVLKKEKETLEKQSSAMSEEVRIQKQTDLQKKLFDLAQRWEKGKQEMANKERTELQGIFQKMDPLISGIAQREGMSMVFEKSDSGLVYAPASMDLTNELVRQYNDKYKSATSSSSSAGKGGAGSKSDAPKK